MATEAEKGLAILRSIAANCDGFDKNNDHSWRTCRSCLAKAMIEPNDSEGGGISEGKRNLRAFLKEYDEICRMIECLHDVPSYIRRLEDATRRKGA